MHHDHGALSVAEWFSKPAFFVFSSQLKPFFKRSFPLLESCTDILVATKELVGVIGRVGSGKTTFLQTIIGELYPLPCLGGSRGSNMTSPWNWKVAWGIPSKGPDFSSADCDSPRKDLDSTAPFVPRFGLVRKLQEHRVQRQFLACIFPLNMSQILLYFLPWVKRFGSTAIYQAICVQLHDPYQPMFWVSLCNTAFERGHSITTT